MPLFVRAPNVLREDGCMEQVTGGRTRSTVALLLCGLVVLASVGVLVWGGFADTRHIHRGPAVPVSYTQP